jgi:hypothetical protein
MIYGCSGKTNIVQPSPFDQKMWESAAANGVLVNEGYERCRRFVEGWLNYADATSGLIPRNINESHDIWNAKDAAADNYPFMVLTAALTDSAMFEGTMKKMLETEERLTSRIGHMPDTYQFSKGTFQNDGIDMSEIIFGSSEYIKDGLMPLTEWLGVSAWSKRMLEILDDVWQYAPIETSLGNIPSENVEVNGEMLQVLSRVYWMTHDQKYLEWAIRLGDYYLLGDRHPTRDFKELRLRDHGCEIVSGLCELYATLHFVMPEKKSEYRPHIHEMLDRILETRNSDGLFYDVVNPQTGTMIKDRVADNFGYNLNGFYTVYQLDSNIAYRDATLKALDVLDAKYRNFAWEDTSSDGYADAIEGALNLYNREPLGSTKSWLDSEIKVMWGKQQDDGIIEGWHGDGNFARTTIMYCLWKTKGVYVKPWRSDLKLGATMSGDTLWMSLQADAPWTGKIYFDHPRHRDVLHLPYDWPRINQFPEWFVVDSASRHKYLSGADNSIVEYSGRELLAGIPASCQVGEPKRIKVY